MNFFFPINHNHINCNLTIPRFKNKKKTNLDFILFSAEIVENRWEIKIVNCLFNENFFFLTKDDFTNEKIFFLAKKQIKNKFFLDQLKIFNDYTATEPDYRANLQIEIENGGFSSYQSDYPYDLTLKTGTVLSPVNVLLNKTAEKNIIFFRNIYKLPIKKKFKIYLVDIFNNRILNEKIMLTNSSNYIDIDSKLINPNIYLFSENYVGIPIFVSIKNNHLSMEHTHPPHLYIWGTDKFKRVNELKNKINDIVKKNTSI